MQELFVEVGCFEKVVEALRLVKEQAKEVGLVLFRSVPMYLTITCPHLTE